MKTVELEKIPDHAFNFLNLSAKNEFTHYLTVVFGEGVFVDFNIRDEPAAIELVNASKKFRVQKTACMEGKITGSIVIGYDFISLRLNLKFEKLSKTYEREIPNLYGLRPEVYEIYVV